uniref:Uncharacterized protein n=1 Tax=Panagrolaimus sp. ES5 TaxID=591445 RepID=A0AC34FN14_9BILA
MVLNNRSIKYENGDTVLFETIIKNLPKLKWLFYYSDFGADITTNSAINLVNIEHLKHFDYLCLNTLSEQLDVETIFDFIIVRYSNRLYEENINGNKSSIEYHRMDYETVSISSSDADSLNENYSFDSHSSTEYKNVLDFQGSNDDDSEEGALSWDTDVE